MSITAIVALIIAGIAALLGAIAGNKVGKSTGRKEGAQKASEQQQITQAKATVQAVQERASVEKKTADSSDADLDSELSKHSRPD